MAKVLTDQTNYTNIANAIRSKNGKTDKYTPAQMPDAIKAIPQGISEGEVNGLLDGSAKTFRVPASATNIRPEAFEGLSDLTINVNTGYNGISGKPWGATNSTINWLKAKKAKVTITQSDNQIITVTDDNGVSYTESFDGYVNMPVTGKIEETSDTYVTGKLTIPEDPLSGDTIISATPAIKVEPQPFPWVVSLENYKEEGRYWINGVRLYPIPLHDERYEGIFGISDEYTFEKGITLRSGKFGIASAFRLGTNADDFASYIDSNNYHIMGDIVSWLDGKTLTISASGESLTWDQVDIFNNDSVFVDESKGYIVLNVKDAHGTYNNSAQATANKIDYDFGFSSNLTIEVNPRSDSSV